MITNRRTFKLRMWALLDCWGGKLGDSQVKKYSFGTFLLTASALFLLVWTPSARAQLVPANILQRIFAIRVGEEQATAFTIEVDRKQYLITARHVIAATSTPTDI
jgi:hypothetical protein